MEIKNSVALVTGGAQGIGKEIVQFLLEEGAKVLFCDLSDEVGEKLEITLKEKFGEDKVKFMKCDVTDTEQLFKVFEDAQNTFGSLDIICNNAGIGSANPRMAQKIIQVNLIAVIEGTFKGIEMMSKKHGHQGGVIINTSSLSGLILTPHMPVYGSSKTAIVAFTRAFANLKEEEGVRVNCICPGYVNTALLQKALAEFPEETQNSLDMYGHTEMKDVIVAVKRCIHEENMAGNAIAVLPQGIVKVVEFTDPLIALIGGQV